MLPSGHIAAGVLLGAQRTRRSEGHPGAIVAGAVASACLPDVDLMVPFLLDRLGVKHGLRSDEHHSWASHTPLFWGLVVTGARRIALRSSSPASAPEAANILAAGKLEGALVLSAVFISWRHLVGVSPAARSGRPSTS